LDNLGVDNLGLRGKIKIDNDGAAVAAEACLGTASWDLTQRGGGFVKIN
jgi:hypothetical protein